MNIGVLITVWVIFMLILYKNDLKWMAEEIIKKFFKKREPVEYFYRKEDGSLGYMSTKEIAERMNRPPSNVEPSESLIEFAKTVRKILEAENAHK